MGTDLVIKKIQKLPSKKDVKDDTVKLEIQLLQNKKKELLFQRKHKLNSDEFAC